MNRSQRILQLSLFAGVIYFLLVSVAHMLGVKVPFLFIYYNIPSYVYQDRIISFLSFGWAMFLFSGAMNVKKNMVEIVKYVLFAGVGAVIGLCIINLSTNFNDSSANMNVFTFWLETILLSAYLVWLTVFYWKARRTNNK
jgi:hypothetical protein